MLPLTINPVPRMQWLIPMISKRRTEPICALTERLTPQMKIAELTIVRIVENGSKTIPTRGENGETPTNTNIATSDRRLLPSNEVSRFY